MSQRQSRILSLENAHRRALRIGERAADRFTWIEMEGRRPRSEIAGAWRQTAAVIADDLG
jgi:hypothetical protein